MKKNVSSIIQYCYFSDFELVRCVLKIIDVIYPKIDLAKSKRGHVRSHRMRSSQRTTSKSISSPPHDDNPVDILSCGDGNSQRRDSIASDRGVKTSPSQSPKTRNGESEEITGCAVNTTDPKKDPEVENDRTRTHMLYEVLQGFAGDLIDILNVPVGGPVIDILNMPVGGPVIDIFNVMVGGPVIDILNMPVGGPVIDILNMLVGGPFIDILNVLVGGPVIDILNVLVGGPVIEILNMLVGGPVIDILNMLVGGPIIDILNMLVGGRVIDILSMLVGGPVIDILNMLVGGPVIDILNMVVGGPVKPPLHSGGDH